VPLLGFAGALALAASSRGRRAARGPDTSRCLWAIPNPIPIDVVRRAHELLARADPLGTEYVEELGGRIYKFRREMHGPNKQIPQVHPGIGVRLCELGANGAGEALRA
jgi:hypothetical protein